MNDDLQKLHNTLLEILEEIDRICRTNNIKYFLDSGTALGAVRHKGFIPWDDDADIGMLRKDYDKFIQIASKELNDKFFLQTRDSDPEYMKFSAKIRKNNTFYPEGRNEGTNIHQGIFVDVFPFDYINDDEKKAIKDIKRARFLLNLFAIRHRRPQKEALHRKIVRGIFRIIPEKYFERKCLLHFAKYNTAGMKKCVCYSYKMLRTKNLYFDLADMETVEDIEFEGKKYSIMIGKDSYLKTMYGDYMTLPPKEKQVWHFEGEIRFE